MCAFHVTHVLINSDPYEINSVACSIGLSLIDSLSLGMVLGCLKNTINLDLAVFNKGLLLCNQYGIF